MRLPRIFRTASFRLAAFYVLVFAASVLVLGAVAFWTTRNALEQQMRARIETEVRFLTREFHAAGSRGLVEAIRQREQGVGALDYLVEGADGRKLAGNLPPVAAAHGWITIEVPGGPNEPGGAERVRAFVVALPGGGMLAVGDGLDRLNDAEEATFTAVAWILAVTALLGIGGGLVLSHGFLRRVDAISRTAEAIIEGDLGRRIPRSGTGDDLDRLAATLNRMLDRIGVLMESLRQVSNDIAHDLRTPLARLLRRLDAARALISSGTGSPGAHAEAIDAAVADAEGILATFGALLEIAEIEAAAAPLRSEDVDLSLVANTVVEAFGPSAEDQGHELVGMVTPALNVRGSRELLTQLLANLVENALRHTPPGTRILVTLARPGARAVRLAVEDDGPGIPAGERSLVLRRFYRCEQSRTTPGNGLGLSLVAAIAGLHDAALSLEDAAPGLRVTILFGSAAGPSMPDARMQTA